MGKLIRLWVLLLAVSLSSCQTDAPNPKPHGYLRIDLPKVAYHLYQAGIGPYSFEFNQSANVFQDKSKYAEPFWLDVHYPSLDCDVQLTYKPIYGDMKRLNDHIEDSRRLVMKHSIKMNGLDEAVFRTKSGHSAFVFQLKGQVPSQFQFYTSDSSQHFLRGALYFKTATKNDSLAPVINYIATDMLHLLKTLEWNKQFDSRLAKSNVIVPESKFKYK